MSWLDEVILQRGPLPAIMNPAAVTALTTMVEQLPQKLGAAAARSKQIEDALAGQGSDPDYAKTVDQFGSMSHQQIYDAVHGGQGGMDVAGLQTIRGVWQSATTHLSTGAQTAWTEIDRLFSDGEWAGESGTAAQSASRRLLKTIDSMSQVFAAVDARVDGLACAAETIRAAVSAPMPEWGGSDPDDPLSQILPGLVNPVTATDERVKTDQATVAVREAMTQLYTPNYPPAGTGVPAYPTVQSIGGDGATAGTSGQGGTTLSPNRAAPSGNEGTQDTTTPQPADENSTAIGDSAGTGTGDETDTGTDSSATGGDESAGQNDSTQTSAAGLGTNTGGDSSASPNATGNATPRTSGGIPTGALGGVGAGVPGLGGAAPGRGAAIPGQPGALSTGSAPGGASGSASGGRLGGGPMGPMMPGAGQRKGGPNDEEHSSPEYLRRVHDDWVDGIIGISPVIGYDPDAASNTAPTSRQAPAISEVPVDGGPIPAPTQVSQPVADDTAPAVTPAASTPNTAAVPPPAPTHADQAAPTGPPVSADPATPPGVSPAVANLLASYGWNAAAPAPTSESGNSVQRPGGERSS
ncbi:hypothetical protein ACTWPB_25265 [Nocardia sp. IBHARD005]|uniref:hypothetical protein n=1 Tax=Nocardia sp. IBHARD005 TaxID=3457765 RepID=UPI00405A2C16